MVKLSQTQWTVAAIVVSGALHFLGSGLHPYWWLAWMAPLPVLLAAPKVRAWHAFLIAVAAYAVGGLSMWQYYRGQMPVDVSLLIVLGPALVSALIVVVYRHFALHGQMFRAAFSLPLLWVAFLYVQEFHARDGSYGNIAYTQMGFLPVIQVASITGIWGIDFLMVLLPAAIAVQLLPGDAARKRRVALTAGGIVVAALGFGLYRLHQVAASPQVTVGLISSDAADPLFPKGTATVELVKQYVAHIPELTAQGAQVVVLPEKIGRIGGADLAEADAILEAAARRQRITIVASFEHLPNLHEMRVFSSDGTLEGTYEKHHLLPPFESHLLPGTTRLTLDRPSGRWGTEICKDMDFPQLSREYANDGAGLMLVSAWDFSTDGWLHGRMAILRGVESGFSLARSVKQGVLTVTDNRGRVLAERDTASAPFTTVVASVPVQNERTLYDRAGDWFAWLDLAAAVVVLGSVAYKAEAAVVAEAELVAS